MAERQSGATLTAAGRPEVAQTAATQPLPADVFEVLVSALAAALIAEIRAELPEGSGGMVGSPRGPDHSSGEAA